MCLIAFCSRFDSTLAKTPALHATAASAEQASMRTVARAVGGGRTSSTSTLTTGATDADSRARLASDRRARPRAARQIIWLMRREVRARRSSTARVSDGCSAATEVPSTTDASGALRSCGDARGEVIELARALLGELALLERARDTAARRAPRPSEQDRAPSSTLEASSSTDSVVVRRRKRGHVARRRRRRSRC